MESEVIDFRAAAQHLRPDLVAASPRLIDLIPRYRLSLEAKKRRPRGIERELWQVTRFMRWMDSEATIADVTDVAIRRYQESIAHLASSTVGNALTSIRGLCRWARRERLMVDDPTIWVEWPKKIRPAPKPLKPEDVHRLFRLIQEPPQLAAWRRPIWQRNVLAIELMLFAGLRLSEAANLRWEHIDLVDALLMVFDGKGGKDRVIPLHHRLQQRLSAIPMAERVGTVLKTQTGKPCSDDCLEHIFSRWLRGLGMTCHAHRLRHTFATQMLRHGADLRSIQVVMGHESLETTMQYILVDPEQTRAAVDCMPADW